MSRRREIFGWARSQELTARLQRSNTTLGKRFFCSRSLPQARLLAAERRQIKRLGFGNRRNRCWKDEFCGLIHLKRPALIPGSNVSGGKLHPYLFQQCVGQY